MISGRLQIVNIECEVSAKMTNLILTEATNMKLARREWAGDLDAIEALATRYEQRAYSLASNAGEKQ